MVSTAAFHARVWGSVPGLGGLKETKTFLPHPLVKVNIAGSLRDRVVACSASDRQGSNFESCVWRTVSSQSSHHPQEVLLAQFSLYVHKGGLKPDSFHFICFQGYHGYGLVELVCCLSDFPSDDFKSNKQICMKFLPEVCLKPMNNWLDFGDDLDCDPDPDYDPDLIRISQICMKR